MVVAAIRRPPAPGGVLTRFDAAAIKSQRGVLAVVEIPSGLAVVAEDYWTARQAADGADLVFAAGPVADYATDKQRGAHAGLLQTAAFQSRASAGNSKVALASAARVFEATFEIPVQAHATMEVMNCTAHVTPDRCE